MHTASVSIKKKLFAFCVTFAALGMTHGSVTMNYNVSETNWGLQHTFNVSEAGWGQYTLCKTIQAEELLHKYNKNYPQCNSYYKKVHHVGFFFKSFFIKIFWCLISSRLSKEVVIWRESLTPMAWFMATWARRRPRKFTPNTNVAYDFFTRTTILADWARVDRHNIFETTRNA